jgi:hypothetical protein
MDATWVAGLFVIGAFAVAVGFCSVLMAMVAFNMTSGGDGTTRTVFQPAVYQPMQMLLARAAAQHGDSPRAAETAATPHAEAAVAA